MNGMFILTYACSDCHYLVQRLIIVNGVYFTRGLYFVLNWFLCCRLLEIGFEDFVRVGSMKKIAKPVLPYRYLKNCFHLHVGRLERCLHKM